MHILLDTICKFSFTVISLSIILRLYNKHELFLFSNVFKNITKDTNNKYLNTYFRSLLIFSLVNLILSIFGFPNCINYNGITYLFYVLTAVHTLVFLIIGFFVLGPKKLFFNFYVVKGKSVLEIIIGTFIFFLLIFIDLIVKPMVISSRLMLNTAVGHSLHSALSELSGGQFAIVFLNCIKIGMYLLQSYLFYMFMYSIYEHTCVAHDEEHENAKPKPKK